MRILASTGTRWSIHNSQVKIDRGHSRNELEKVFLKNGDSPLAHESEPAYNLAAGWSSPVAREAHNLEVAGSNPVSATLKTSLSNFARAGFFYEVDRRGCFLVHLGLLWGTLAGQLQLDVSLGRDC